ncbi:inner membrane protein [Selenomonas sp. GACV-9]|uniref:metal-dependent hydrolase n=1 Tax=Selenomonas sp. GACV-9 TaxID=3158782 RepID=UPI0008ED8DF3|nr:inner membrane protein [Selenomonas ruminantium]
MKWVNHEVVTGVIVYAAVQDPLPALYSMAGAIMPDKLEGNPRSNDYWSWRSRHRGWSHWPMLYLLLLGLQLRILDGGVAAFFDLGNIGVYFCIGALLHIAEDAVCGKVPFITPWQKVGIKLFAVGSVTEYIFSIVVVLLSYMIQAGLVLK